MSIKNYSKFIKLNINNTWTYSKVNLPITEELSDKKSFPF